MKQEGQFILMNLDEFGPWLAVEKISRKIKLVQNHHTWKPDYSSFKGNNHFSLLAGMKRSHLQRGFTDIAQNLTTFPDGSIAVCRPLNTVPAGIKGANAGGICIEHVGNFDMSGDILNDKHKETIIRMNAILCKTFSLTPNADSLVYHHWYDLNTGKRKNGEGSTKSCPGTNFFGGNKVEDANKNFIPKIMAAINSGDFITESPIAENETFHVRYSKKGEIPYGKEVQKFLNQFPDIELEVDGCPGKNTSNAFKKITGYYLIGDPRVK